LHISFKGTSTNTKFNVNSEKKYLKDKFKIMKKLFQLSVLFLFTVNTYAQVGINTPLPQGAFHIDGNKDNSTTAAPTVLQQVNDFIVKSNGQVGIGTATPDASAILDVSSTNKGILGPRISLESITDAVTVPTPATGLLVYNTGIAGLKYVGYVFWNGGEWRTFNNSSLQTGTVGTLLCNSATITPTTYTAGTPYNGTLNIPYTGGNGGIYSAITIGPINGLTATLPSGNFNSGPGNIIFTVTGTPTVSSPTTTTFGLTLGGQICSAEVGNDLLPVGGISYWSGGMLASTSNVLASGSLAMPIIENTFRLDAFFSNNSNGGPGSVTFTPRIYNITAGTVKIWWGGQTSVEGRGNSNVILASNGYQDLDNGMYLNTGENMILGTSTPSTGVGLAYDRNSQETMEVDLFYSGRYYKITFTALVDNMNTSATADNMRRIYVTYQRIF